MVDRQAVVGKRSYAGYSQYFKHSNDTVYNNWRLDNVGGGRDLS